MVKRLGICDTRGVLKERSNIFYRINMLIARLPSPALEDGVHDTLFRNFVLVSTVCYILMIFENMQWANYLITSSQLSA